MKIKVSPSVLAADFVHLKREIQAVESTAAMLHLDVMDGHFVPNISIGVPVVASVANNTDLFLDVHLMITHPLDYVKAFADAGADLICFHLESDSDVQATIDAIKACGKQVGIALKPATDVSAVLPYLSQIDMVLVMTVEPGFGGQSFMPDMLGKIRAIRATDSNIDIQVDGGINRDTASLVVDAGANVLVAGSFVFCSENPAGEVAFLNSLQPR